MQCGDDDDVCHLPQVGLLCNDVEQAPGPSGDIMPLLFDEETRGMTILADDNGIQQSSDALRGKIVGLYFSASWCPPCRKFSPELSRFRAARGDDFVVVFVSSDESEADAKSFCAGKGFLNVPFHNKARLALERRLGVSMLPTLVILDAASGRVLTDWGRAAVMRNPKGCIEAWRAGGHGCSWLQLLTGGSSCSVQ